jgi:glutamate-ammonia-ligase adenylyltransferase
MGYGSRGQGSGVRDQGQQASRGDDVNRHPQEVPASGPASDPRPLAPQKRSPLDESPEPTLDTRRLLVDPLDLFLKDFHDKTATNRAILDHLLHQTFAGDAGGSEPESDLILDPDADDAAVTAVLKKYPFRDVKAAHHNLNRLGQEAVPFLSHRRCRHFLASIAAPLLRAVADTPDPDGTLNNLERVTASLGAKAVLYELFSFNPPSLKLYVDICASSPYLSGILTSNPGMIDELLDSLVLDQPRSAAELTAELTELLRGASDVDPILHSFQDKELLRLGVQDMLNKASIRATTAGLSDLADAILNAVFDLTEPGVKAKLGDPAGEYAVLGLGKLGGREISYHSDLDVVLVYADCQPGVTEARHYFTTLAQQAIKLAGRPGPLGRLYEVDMRLRPTGKSGSLALSLDEFRRYFGCTAQVWERLALTRARVVRGGGPFADQLMACVRQAVTSGEVPTAEVAAMRAKLETAANPRSLKRGRGGLADVEFAVQLLQLRHGRNHPEVLKANVWEALEALQSAGLLGQSEMVALRDGYSFLRFVEARLRIVTDRPLTEVPENPDDLAKLARRIGFLSPVAFLGEVAAKRAMVRKAYERVMG